MFMPGFTQTVPFWDRESAALKTGRKLRVSPLFTRMEPNARFGQSMGYERPLYFVSDQEKEDGNSGSYTALTAYSEDTPDNVICMSHFTLLCMLCYLIMTFV